MFDLTAKQLEVKKMDALSLQFCTKIFELPSKKVDCTISVG